MAIAQEHDLIVIEDVAQALGVVIAGKMAGTFGNIGVYSFHSHKNLTTLGEGGMLVVRDAEWAEVIPMLRHNGHCDFSYERQDYWIPAMGNVDLPELTGNALWPMNCCLGEVECALGTQLLERANQMNSEKRDRALTVIDALSGYPELVFHREASTRHNYHLLVAQVKEGLRDVFIRKMATCHGIQCVVQYYPLNRYPFYQKLNFGVATLPYTDSFFDNMVSFPFNHLLTDSNIEKIIAASRQTLDDLRRL
jgi:dTDP-4-amino-4,6-dideoxygalactose transaminase